jgi:hypothetical protein
MRHIGFICAIALLAAATLPAMAQNAPPPLAPIKPYKPVAIVLPQPMSDAGLAAMRKQLGEAAQHKDRAALARLVVAQGFFWERENGDGADKLKPGVDNLAAALSLNSKDSAGWDMLTNFAEDPTASPSPEHKGVVCTPADPAFDGKALDDLIDATQTDPADWGYPVSAGIQVHAGAQANAPVIDTLGLAFVRVLPETVAASPSYLRIVTPSGKIGFVSIDSIAPVGNDQICYVKDAGAWKIGGYVGGGAPQ